MVVTSDMNAMIAVYGIPIACTVFVIGMSIVCKIKDWKDERHE